MEDKTPDSIEKIRQQFDSAPYPRIPLEDYPRHPKLLSVHSLATPYYLRYQKVADTQGKVILDAGCGSGYKSLALAVANPGSQIVGIDLSEESVKLAKQRLQYHGFSNVEFYVLAIEDLPSFGREFDYINSDEVLYLLPDPSTGLRAMKSVLKPEGIIRTNLHSSLQRKNYFTAQKVFKMMGLMDENPGELEIDLVREMMEALKDDVLLKAHTWRPEHKDHQQWYLMNYLFQGDTGYTIPEMFAALKAADLEFITMVAWPQWELMNLFKEPDDLPVFLAMSLPILSVQERLHLYELLNPVRRLLDFWCGHPNSAAIPMPLADWTDEHWAEAMVYLHPNLKVPEVKQEMLTCITNITPFEIAQYLPFAKESALLMDSTVASCVVPLWDGPQSMLSLTERWCQVRPVHPVTLEPTDQQAAFETVKQMLTSLEQIGFVLLELPPE